MSYQGEHKKDSWAAVILIIAAAALIAVMLWMNGQAGTEEAVKLPARSSARTGDGAPQDANVNRGR